MTSATPSPTDRRADLTAGAVEAAQIEITDTLAAFSRLVSSTAATEQLQPLAAKVVRLHDTIGPLSETLGDTRAIWEETRDAGQATKAFDEIAGTAIDAARDALALRHQLEQLTEGS